MSAQTSENKKRKFRSYFKGVRAEMKKVTWPTKRELVNHTGIVILISVAIALVIWVLDIGIHRILSLFI